MTRSCRTSKAIGRPIAGPTRRRLVWLLMLLGFATWADPSVSQETDGAVFLPDPFQLGDFGSGPYQEMTALLEVTIFNIDVLTLTVRVGPDTGARLRSLIEGRAYSDELADSVAMVILEADEAWARQVFRRGVSLGRLTGGMRETAEKAEEAGFISEEFSRDFVARLPEWFAFLEAGGAREGDAIYFRTQGDEVRTIYQTSDGQIVMDRTGVDAEARRGSIPSFFAPETRFRKRLVESLLAYNTELRK